jgi:hypothetical protein
MHSAIVYAVLPTEPYEAHQKGAVFLAAIQKLEGNKSAERLGEFVWAINFQESPAALAVFVTACEQQSLPYGILPLGDAPQWIRRDPNSKG